MTIAHALYSLRVKRKMTAKELGLALGYGENIASTVISAIECGRRGLPKKKYTLAAQVLGVEDDYFIKLNKEEPELPNNAIPVSVTNLPIYGSVAAGLGIIPEEEIEGYYTIPDIWIKDSPDDYFLLRVQGDSMEPKIPNGSLALIRKQTSVLSGSVAVVLVSEDGSSDFGGVIKRVIYDKNTITLHSFNEAYDDRVFEGPDVLKIRVVGVVKSIVQDFE